MCALSNGVISNDKPGFQGHVILSKDEYFKTVHLSNCIYMTSSVVCSPSAIVEPLAHCVIKIQRSSYWF